MKVEGGMSVIASYARVRTSDLERIRADPEAFWEIDEMPWDLSETDPQNSEGLELDKMWDNLSWLCSPLGRAEAHHMAALVRMGIGNKDKHAVKAALAREVAAMGLTWVDPDSLPDDLVLSAIQGRRGENQTADIAELGLNASVFTPEEVASLSSALNTIDLDELRGRFDVREIETLRLGGNWEESELDEFYLPSFFRLRTLYSRAATAGQHVIVVMS
jgi:hypothetical protein